MSQSSEDGGVEVGSSEERKGSEGVRSGDPAAATRSFLYMFGTAFDVSEGTRGEMMAWSSINGQRSNLVAWYGICRGADSPSNRFRPH
jgi:hypothetical protein